MTPIETLMHEHKVILMVLGAAEKDVAAIRSTHKVDAVKAQKYVDFIRNFADKCHHAKEEDLLFVKMQERGMPKQGGPIAVMLRDHAQGREYVAAIAESIPHAAAGDEAAQTKLANNLASYIDLLRNHIGKEDNILYPMAQQVLSADDMKFLEKEFERVEREEMGEGTHERFHQLAHELAK